LKAETFMLIAGEASGDMLAAELVAALREKVLEIESEPTDDVQPLRTALAPRFFGAGGPKMAAAGAELAFDMTQHSVIGISDVLKNYLKFRRLFNQLLKLAIERQPDAIIGVDSGRQYVRNQSGMFQGWNPKIIQFVSPQVWASRPGRANLLAADYDLLLSIFPFEKDWYAKRVPKLKVEFVGHPMVERFRKSEVRSAKSEVPGVSPSIVLLPGSRAAELRRHLPVMLGALELIRAKQPEARAKMVLPSESLAQLAKPLGTPSDLEIQVADLPQALAQADLAIASTGTVTMECAFFGVPTVTLYKTSWSTYEIAKRIVTVKWLTMPNLLAGEEVYSEFVQNGATPENISRAALELLNDEARRKRIKAKLAEIVASLGGPGANARAADAIVRLLNR
jgi:lipid-A-disaccharide synthase